jgi:hypothetical protein
VGLFFFNYYFIKYPFIFNHANTLEENLLIKPKEILLSDEGNSKKRDSYTYIYLFFILGLQVDIIVAVYRTLLRL